MSARIFSVLPLLLAALLAALAPHAAYAAQITFITPTAPFIAGQSGTITWSYDAAATGAPAGALGTLSLTRINGNPNNMTPITTIAREVDPTAGSFTWSVPADLPNASDYALQFQWAGASDAATRFSGTFSVTGGPSDATTASGGGAVATAAPAPPPPPRGTANATGGGGLVPAGAAPAGQPQQGAAKTNGEVGAVAGMGARGWVGAAVVAGAGAAAVWAW
ncbi:hypothetical protein GGF32_009359 [Allomyces javanicus]|nr:hypothetical protein GGF32_009359 [Allomyces javanicus]